MELEQVEQPQLIMVLAHLVKETEAAKVVRIHGLKAVVAVELEQ
jgi:hypothetical protein